MPAIKLEINIQVIQDEILSTFQGDPYTFPSLLSILEFLDVKIKCQWQEQLSNLTLAGEIEKYGSSGFLVKKHQKIQYLLISMAETLAQRHIRSANHQKPRRAKNMTY